MATYYVRTDGNNANAGTGPAVGQAWATIAYALANAALPDATNTIYIAPGTYRGTVTMSITPSVSNTLVVAGDPTAAQFSGVTAGRVRITTFTTDNTGTPTSSQTLTCDNKTYFTLRNLHIEGYQTSTGQGIAHFLNAKNYTVEKCVFSLYRRGNSSSCVFSTTTTTTAISATFDKCIIFGGYAGLNIQSPSTGSAFDLSMNVKDCIFTYNGSSVIVSNPSEGIGVGNGITFYNNILLGTAILYLRSSNTSNKTFFYNNAICAFTSIGLDASANTVTEDYNRFSCATDRSGPATGSNSQSGVFAVDIDYSRITGLYALDFFASYNGSIAQNTGTLSGAPTVDIFGDAWTSTNPDVGAATFKIASSVGQYNPTERNASAITIAPGSTSQSIELYLGATGLTSSTSGLSARYNRSRTASVAITLVARTIAQAWTSGGFAEVDATNMPGVYRLDLPDAAVAAGADDVTVVVRGAAGTNGAVITIKLSSGGLTAAQTTSAVWDATASAYNTAGSMGEAGQKLTGYSLASSQAFNNTGSIGSVTGAVGSVTGAVTVGTNNDKTGYSLSTGGVSDVAGKVWDEPYTSHTTANSFGARTLKTTVDNRPADVGTSNHIQANVHAIVDSTAAASELSGALLHNGTDYISAELVTPVSTASLIYMGPFQVIADGVTTPQPLDIQKGTQQGIGIQLVDNNLAGISITGATITAKVYNSGGTLVATYSGTATYAADGRAQFTITTTVTNTPGTYTATITRTTGASDTQVFGPLRIYVRDI